MNLLFSTTSVVEKKSDILYNRSGVKNSIFWVKNQKRRGNSMRKKKLWKKHCALGMAIVLASGNAVTPALADNTAVQVDNDTENDNKAENLDFETKETPKAIIIRKTMPRTTPTRQIQISQKRMILKILERMPEILIKKEQTKIPPDPTKQMKKSPKQKMRIKTQDLTMKQKMMK